MEYYTDDNGNRVLVRHKGPAGLGIPAGGAVGQILVKSGAGNYVTSWANPPEDIILDAVTGPASAVNGNFALFDGTTGKVIKDSTRSISYFATASALATKVDSVLGKGLSENDFTDALAAKLDSLSEGGYRGTFDVVGSITGFIPNPGDYVYLEEPGEIQVLATWDDTNNVWQEMSLDPTAMTGAEIAAALFATDEVYDKEDCVIFTSGDRATLEIHDSILNASTGGVGATATAYIEKTSAYVITLNDRTINCTSGSFTLTLPTAVGNTGRIYVIKNSGAGGITVATTAGQTIDGSATVVLTTQWEFVTIQSTGSNWILV